MARHQDTIGTTVARAPVYATYFEGADAAPSTLTNYTISPGDSFQGYIGYNDEDFVRISLTAGQSYTITVTGGTLDDPFVGLFSGSGNLLDWDDDSAGGLNPRLSYTATYTGTYYIDVTSFDVAAGITPTDFGTYTLSVSGTATPTLDQMASYLAWEFWWDQSEFPARFDTSASNQLTVNISGLTAGGMQLARWAMDVWESYANIRFVETTGSADITFQDHETGAFTTSNTYIGPAPAYEDFMSSATVNIDSSWLSLYGDEFGSYSHGTYVHELGHALGLGHMGNYNTVATYGIDETFINDSVQLSVMSYFTQSENTSTNASDAEPVSPMMVDVIAIQYLYGAPVSGSPTWGNTTWGIGTNMTGFWADLASLLNGTAPASIDAGNDFALTIYDVGGVDTLNLSFSTDNDRVDLNDTAFSDVGGLIGNLGIARGTVIENLVTGSGHDTVTGNEANNRIVTGAGNDSARGESGSDFLDGGLGSDSLFGGLGNDTIFGGGWNDYLVGNIGNDWLRGDNADDTLLGGDGNDILGGNVHNDSLVGGEGDDGLWGGSDNDILEGGNGNDTLGGGHDDDVLYGGNGLDDLRGGGGRDTIYGGGWADRLDGSFSDDLLFGEAGNDTLIGGVGNDTMDGGDLNDVLWGGWGNDILIGGLGADTFIFGGTFGFDRVNDFSVAQGDILRLDDNMWFDTHGALTEAQVLSQFGSVSGANLVFTFGAEVLTLVGMGSAAGFEASIEII